MGDRTTASARISETRDALADRYRVLRTLGEGGMATVYLAEQLSDGSAVAIKVLHREFSISILADRFQREIGLLSALEHPHILPVLASAAAGRLLYYVMPYARDGSLSDRLETRQGLTVDEALAVARPIAEALDYAHRHSVIHRDIKPGNILFDGDRVVLCDFGVARALVNAGGERLSTSGLIVGTPSYMSPEQAGGQPVDGRSDVYSLACVVYEMLAAEPPFTGHSARVVIARQMHERPPVLRIVRPDVPQSVEDAITQALAKDPAERPATGLAFSSLLTRA